VRDVDMWEDLHTHSFGGDVWGTRAVQSMLATLGKDPGPVDGANGAATQSAIRDFQSEQGLAVDGSAGPATRKKLYLAYMDAICQDETGAPFVLEKTDFLGKGADAGGKADYQGCSEFNPLKVFSKDENDALSQPSQRQVRNDENAPNRRVLIFLFPP